MRVHHDPRPPKKRRSLKEHRQYFGAWFGGLPRAGRVTVIVVLVLVVLGVAGAVLPEHQSASDRFIHEHYPEWRAECEDRATLEVDAGGFYTVGGTHWVGLVNKCITELADDQTP